MRVLPLISVILPWALSAVAGAASPPRQSWDAGWGFERNNAPDVAQMASVRATHQAGTMQVWAKAEGLSEAHANIDTR
jgi:hypothetical protein